MSIKDTIETTLCHIRSKAIDLGANDPHRTKEQRTAAYWCGRQTGVTLFDFLDALHQEGIISFDEMVAYQERTRHLYRLLDEAYHK